MKNNKERWQLFIEAERLFYEVEDYAMSHILILVSQIFVKVLNMATQTDLETAATALKAAADALAARNAAIQPAPTPLDPTSLLAAAMDATAVMNNTNNPQPAPTQ